MISDEARKVYQKLGIPVDNFANTSGQFFTTPGQPNPPAPQNAAPKQNPFRNQTGQ